MKKRNQKNNQLGEKDFIRLTNNFYNSKGFDVDIKRLETDQHLFNYINDNKEFLNKKYKVALLGICLNPLYWEFAPEMIKGAGKYFLPGHDTDFFFWTDIPENDKEISQKLQSEFKRVGVNTDDHNMIYHDIMVNGKQMNISKITDSIINLRKTTNVTVIPTESIEWPYPTLLRYNLFLQIEEKLKEYDYIFYCDVDMKFIGIVGDEILGPDLTAAPHPGYAIRKEYYPPYEPNEMSACYIPRPGRVIQENGKQRFRPEYYAGGLQGGTSKSFIQAMKGCKELIDKDLKMGYIPIWNDETAWNKYLFENTPTTMLNPSYIYPDSLLNEYYIPLWGRDYPPKLVTITKWFTISKEGGEALKDIVS